jgi:hypothetical protein
MLTEVVAALEDAPKRTVQVMSGFLSFLFSSTLQVTTASGPLGPRDPLWPL